MSLKHLRKGPISDLSLSVIRLKSHVSIEQYMIFPSLLVDFKVISKLFVFQVISHLTIEFFLISLVGKKVGVAGGSI